MTLTGCLTPPAANVTGSPFTLVNATGGTMTTPQTFALMGGDPTSMQQFGNSRVEIIGSMQTRPAAGSQIGTSPVGAGTTGTVGTSGAGVTPPTGTTTPGSPTGTSTGTVVPSGTNVTTSMSPTPGSLTPPPMPNFRVTSMRQVPGNCGGQF